MAAHPSAHYFQNAPRFPKNTADSADLVLLRGSAWSCGRYWLSLQRLSASITILPITTPLETVVARLFNLQLLHSYCWLCLTCTNLYHAGKHSAWDDTRSLIKTLTSGGMVLKNKSYPADSDSASHSTYPRKYGPTYSISYSRGDMKLLQHCPVESSELETTFKKCGFRKQQQYKLSDVPTIIV